VTGRGVVRFARELIFGSRLASQRREELRHHLEMLAEELEHGGESPEESRRRARIEFGEPDVVAEELRDGRLATAIGNLFADLRLGARGLVRAPGFAVTAVLLVALGVGASTAVFTLFSRVLLRPLPYPAAERLVSVWEASPERGIDRIGVAHGNVAAWRREASRGGEGTRPRTPPVFEGLAITYTMGRTLTHGGESEVVLAAQVSADFFSVFGVTPAHGRTFTDEECERAVFSMANAPAGADPVALLGQGLFLRRFGGDPSVVGRTVQLDRISFRVVGVMPPGFAMPEPNVDLFIPWTLSKGILPRDQRYVTAFARLADGVTPGQAEQRLAAVARALAAETPESNRGWEVRLAPLQGERTSGVRPALRALMGAVVLLLLIACSNVAILLLARGVSRAHETALMLSLGATRGRVVRPLLFEALLLTAAGGALGWGLAVAAIAVVRRIAPELPRIEEVAVDLPGLAFAIAATLVAAALSAAAPALRAARLDPRLALQDGGGRTTAGTRGCGTHDALVALEVALTVVLLAGAGLLVRSVRLLGIAGGGFDPRGVLVAPVFLDTQRYGSGAKVRAYYTQLFERLRGVPGVTSVGAATTLPTSTLGPDFERPVWPQERTGDDRAVRHAAVRMVTTDYFATLGVPVVEGRPFGEQDTPDAPKVVSVSRSLARLLWPGQRAVGKRLVVDYSTGGTYPYEVVGVVDDVRFRGPRSVPGLEIYFPHTQRPYLVLNVAVRVRGDETAAAAAVRNAFHDLDPAKPPHGVYRLSDLVGATYARERHAMRLLVSFAALACFLSACGVYGLLAYRVRQRRREIGIRMALGAGPSRVVLLVAGEGARLIAAGGLAGLALALAATRLLSSLLFGVTPTDPLTGLVVLLLLGALGLVASGLPALRAARIDASRALRSF
jgi:putative ABC transport system permease protein